MIISLLMPVTPAALCERRRHINRLLVAPDNGREAHEQRNEVAQPENGDGHWHLDPPESMRRLKPALYGTCRAVASATASVNS
jgi:hypothetical protein